MWDSLIQRHEVEDYTQVDVDFELLGVDVHNKPEVLRLTIVGRTDGGLLGYRSLHLIPAEGKILLEAR